MRFLPRAFTTTVLTTLITVQGAPDCFAQGADQDEFFDLGTLVLTTARKREEPIKDVPFAVDVQSGTELQERRAYDAASALRDVSNTNVPVFASGDRQNALPIIRGVGPISNPLSPDDSSVLTFVDGAPLPLAASISGYLDLERAEVLKGPQSTLFGRNTAGGAINLVPAQPTFDFEAYVGAELGTDGLHQAELVVSGPIINDVLAGRIALLRNGVDGFIDNLFGPSLGKQEAFTGRATLLYTPNDRTRWTFSLSGEQYRSEPVFFFLSPGPLLAAQNLARDDSDTLNFSTKFEYDFERFTFTSQTSYATFDADNDFQIDFRLASLFTGGVLPPVAFSDPTLNFNSYRKDETRFTQEFRLTSVENAPFSWLAGLSYYEDDSAFDISSDFYGLVFGSPIQSGSSTYDNLTKGYAAFGEIGIPVTQSLEVSVGARYAREEKDFVGTYDGSGFVAVGAVPFLAEAGSENYDYWTGRIGVTYDWTDEVTSYASISRGFRTGSFPVFNSSQVFGLPRSAYGSSEVLTYEIGTRASLLNGDLQISGAVFFNDVDDEQFQIFDPATFVVFATNIDTESVGFEFDATYQLSSNWSLSGGLGYIDARLRNVTPVISAAQPGVASGNRLPFVSEWSASASVSYRAPLASWGFQNTAPGTEVFGRLDYNFIGENFYDAANLGVVEDVHLLSARFGVEWG
ncbi:MAG: TonB-dependent receptor, partial [Pseudomonadota bacterium]